MKGRGLACNFLVRKIGVHNKKFLSREKLSESGLEDIDNAVFPKGRIVEEIFSLTKGEKIKNNIIIKGYLEYKLDYLNTFKWDRLRGCPRYFTYDYGLMVEWLGFTDCDYYHWKGISRQAFEKYRWSQKRLGKIRKRNIRTNINLYIEAKKKQIKTLLRGDNVFFTD